MSTRLRLGRINCGVQLEPLRLRKRLRVQNEYKSLVRIIKANKVFSLHDKYPRRFQLFNSGHDERGSVPVSMRDSKLAGQDHGERPQVTPGI